jgi:phosphoribosylaminoimidazolecarboxamide formyltransferase/IMP cyclohydrolase
VIHVRRALLSLSDKTGLPELARALQRHGAEILSTGGTARALAELGVPVTGVADVTGHPEVFGGRVKTLHPRIHGGILFRRDVPSDLAEAETHGIRAIDLVAVTLYPFERTVAREGVSRAEAIEEIDIGGPALIRAAAKNAASVVVLTDPSQYAEVLAEIERDGGVSEETARGLAAAAYARTSAYDAAIAAWMTGPREACTVPRGVERFLRYGENPHQSATAFAIPGERGGVLQAQVLQGKDLSFNNLVDLDAAWVLARDLRGPGVAIIKHANPCGAAESPDLVEALAWARACDPVSAFGGVYAFDEAVDAAVARALLEGFFVECVIAPAFSAEAQEVLAAKKNVRVLMGPLPPPQRAGRETKFVTGGALTQDWDDLEESPSEWTCATKREPTEKERAALEFAWRVTKHVKSNAIVFCGPGRTLGIGAGQSSRVDSVELAVLKARKHGLDLRGSVVGSDAFFPFRDGVDAIAAAGATAIVQPGGSVRDPEVVAACDEHGLAMLFTGRRHFRH